MQMDVTKRFAVTTPQRKFPMKARAPFASILKSFSSVSVGYTSLPRKCTFCHLLQPLLNWRINVVINVNSTQMSLKWTGTIHNYVCGSLVCLCLLNRTHFWNLLSELFSTSAIRNAFASHKLPNIHFCEHFLQISHNLRTINAQINISGEKTRKLDTLAKLHCIFTRLSENLELAEIRTPRRHKNWADELWKLATLNVALHSVLSHKSEINLND